MSNSVQPVVGGFIQDLIVDKVKAAILAKLQEIKDALAAGDATAIETVLKWIVQQTGIKIDLMQFFELYLAFQSGNWGRILSEAGDVLKLIAVFFPVAADPNVQPSNPSIRVPVMLFSSTGDPLAACNDAVVSFEQAVAPRAAVPGQPVEFIPEAVAIITLFINLVKFVRDRRKPMP